MGFEPLIILIAIGAGVLLGLRFPLDKTTVAGFIALSFWMGFVMSAFAITLGAVITGRIMYHIIWIVLALAIAAIVLRRSDWLPAVKTIKRPKLPESKTQYLWLLPAAALIIFMIIQVFMTTRLAVSFPIIGFDAIGNFGLKGKLWFFTRELYPADLTNPEYLIFKRRYPPAIPIIEGVWATIYGGWVDQKMKYIFVMFWLSIGLLIWSELKMRGGRVFHWVGAAMWIMLPFGVHELFGGAVSGFGDIPFAMAMLAGIIALRHLHKSTSWQHAILLGIFIASPMWIKKEGLPFVLAALIYLGTMRASWRHFVSVVSACVVFYIVHSLTTRGLPHFFEKDVVFDLSVLGERYDRIRELIAIHLDDKKQWGKKFWYLLGAVWLFRICYGRMKTIFSWELFFFFFMFSVYTLVFLFTAFNFDRTFDSTFDRIFIHIYPLLLIATFAGLELIYSDDRKSNFNRERYFPVIVFLLLSTYIAYLQYKQTKDNKEDYEWGIRVVKEEKTSDHSHPLMMLGNAKFVSSVKAIEDINSSRSNNFWLQAPVLDPAISFNYYVFPKNVRATVKTQLTWNDKALSLINDPIPNDEPETWDIVVIIDEADHVKLYSREEYKNLKAKEQTDEIGEAEKE